MALHQAGWFWDPRKAAANFAKHGVSFELATLVFEDPFQLNETDDHPGGEQLALPWAIHCLWFTHSSNPI